MNAAGKIAARLESAFERIRAERMIDVPILNAKLAVRAVGFREWQDDVLGVLVTPWCMNVMLLPGESAAWPAVPVGTKTVHQLPSGSFEFIEGEEAGVGRYRMCSLFSPMHEFRDQETAVGTAEAALTALMSEEAGQAEQTPDDAARRRPMTRRELLRGRAPAARGDVDAG